MQQQFCLFLLQLQILVTSYATAKATCGLFCSFVAAKLILLLPKCFPFLQLQKRSTVAAKFTFVAVNLCLTFKPKTLKFVD